MCLGKLPIFGLRSRKPKCFNEAEAHVPRKTEGISLLAFRSLLLQ